MTSESPSDEALAQAREQLEAESEGREGVGFIAWSSNALVTERATVIELRRQLADIHNAAAGIAAGADALRTELATERQRLEESESDRRTQYCRADAAERLLATERQRAEAAEQELSTMRTVFDREHVDLAASEAKRKALREALLDVGQIVIQMRIPTVEESASGHDRALREKGEVHTIWTKALAADAAPP